MKRRRYSLWNVFCITTSSLTLLVLGVLGTGAYLWMSVPAYWAKSQATMEAMTKVERAEMVGDVENRINTWLKRSDGRLNRDGSKPQWDQDAESVGSVVSVTDAQQWLPVEKLDSDNDGQLDLVAGPPLEMSLVELNTWASANLPNILRQEGWPGASMLSDPMIAIESGQIVAATRVSRGNFNQVVSAVLEYRVQDDGQVWLKLDKVRGGKLGVSAKMAKDPLTQVLERLGPENRALLESLMAGKTVDPTPILRRLGAERNLRISDMKLTQNSLKLALESFDEDQQ